jgi:hypothetical protein
MKCYICHQPLTDPLSIKLGIGPVCRAKQTVKHKPNGNDLFGNRADYSWGIDGNLLWLKDQSISGRSLTNDMEVCLCEIQAALGTNRPITDYSIVYKDSEGVWDGVRLTRFDLAKVINVDAKWVEVRGGHYMPAFLEIDFYHIGAKSFEVAKTKVLV